MDRRERWESEHEAMLAAFDGRQAEIWTALPAIVKSFDASKLTVTVQPAVMGRVQAQDGSWSDVKMPELPDVPLFYPCGGGFTLTFPIVAGDEVLVVFGSRCIDAWWYYGGEENAQAVQRMHDLSDGFAIAGFRSKPRPLSAISTTSTQLRSDDGAAYVEIGAAHAINVHTSGDVGVQAANANVVASGDVNVQAGSTITLQAPTVQITGDLDVSGTISQSGSGTASFGGSISASGEGTFNGHTVGAHTHPDPQGGSTGTPTG
jgi:phage baseplate assembly protein gpV